MGQNNKETTHSPTFSMFANKCQRKVTELCYISANKLTIKFSPKNVIEYRIFAFVIAASFTVSVLTVNVVLLN